MANPNHGIVKDIRSDAASMPGRVEVEAPGVIDLPEGRESGFPDLKDLRDVLKEIDIERIERALTKPAGRRGRRPYPRGPMIRAYLPMPHQGISDISDLHKKLLNDPALRAVCGRVESPEDTPSQWVRQ